jgi:hypothetical protein
MTGDIIEAAKFIGAGLSMIGALGAGIGIGLSVQGALEGMARNPDTWQPADQHDPGNCLLGSYCDLLPGNRFRCCSFCNR